MDNIKQIVLQEMNERRFNKRLIDSRIKEWILENGAQKIEQGVELVNEFLSKEYYESKNNRLAQLKLMDIEKVVVSMFVGIAYVIREELFTSVSAQMAGRLGFSDKKDSITTTAELLAVLCETDVFDINKSSKQASLVIVSRMLLPDDLKFSIEHSAYLPPMVCEPLELTDNYSSGYLSHKDSLILGNGNHHDGDICLDVLNIMNKVCLKLDTKYLCTIEEEPTFELDTPEKIEQWHQFKKQSYGIYSLLAEHGNEFYMTHKVDKRGRIYSQGYHVNPQGASFKKAMVELAKEEIITGMP